MLDICRQIYHIVYMFSMPRRFVSFNMIQALPRFPHVFSLLACQAACRKKFFSDPAKQRSDLSSTIHEKLERRTGGGVTRPQNYVDTG